MELLFGFSGRTSRSGWWIGQVVVLVWLTLMTLLGIAVAGFSISDLETMTKHEKAGAGASILLFGLVALIPAVWINAAVTIKRFHDRDKSGFWYCVCFVPYVGVIWQVVECGFFPGTPGGNRYGLPTTSSRGGNWQDVDYMQETADRYGSQSQEDRRYTQNGLGYQPIVDRNRKTRQLEAGNDKPMFGRRNA